MTFIKAFYSWLEQIGKARAAAHFAQKGDYESALKLMTGD